MHEALAFFTTGATLGLAAGLTPGPLMMLIFAQTLAHGHGEGSKVAAAPLFTDGPVMLFYLAALNALSAFPAALGLIGLVGGIVVVRFGLGCLRSGPLVLAAPTGSPGSWTKGLATNFFNPKMHLYWATVGSPMLLSSLQRGAGSAVGYLSGFYLCLVGANLGLVWLSGRFREFLSGRAYVVTMRVIGLLLLLAAAGLFWDGLSRLGLARTPWAG